MPQRWLVFKRLSFKLSKTSNIAKKEVESREKCFMPRTVRVCEFRLCETRQDRKNIKHLSFKGLCYEMDDKSSNRVKKLKNQII